MILNAKMLFTEAEIKELISAIGEVRRILRDSVKNGCQESKSRLKLIEEVMEKLEIR